MTHFCSLLVSSIGYPVCCFLALIIMKHIPSSQSSFLLWEPMPGVLLLQSRVTNRIHFFFFNLEQKGYMEKRVEFCLYLCPDFILPFSFETISNSKAFTQLSKIPKTARLSGAGMNFRQNKLVEHWCKCVITMIQAVVKSQDVLALSRAWHSMRLWLREWSRKLLSPRV